MLVLLSPSLVTIPLTQSWKQGGWHRAWAIHTSALTMMWRCDQSRSTLRCATMALHMGVPCILTDLHHEPFKLMVWRMQVAGGQGTIALELLSQLPAHELDAVFVPVGGGGLISGNDQCALTTVSKRPPVTYIAKSADLPSAIALSLCTVGIASVLAAHKPKVKVVGCQPENSCIMAKSMKAGMVVNEPSRNTLSEGTAG